MLHDPIFTTGVDVRQRSVDLWLSPEFDSSDVSEFQLLCLTAKDCADFEAAVRVSPDGFLTRASIRWGQGAGAAATADAPESWCSAVSSGNEERIGDSIALRLAAGLHVDSYSISWGPDEEDGYEPAPEFPTPRSFIEDTPKSLTGSGLCFPGAAAALPRVAVEIAKGRENGIFHVLALPGVVDSLKELGVETSELTPNSRTSAVNREIDVLSEVEPIRDAPVTWYCAGMAAMLEMTYFRI